LFSLLWKKGAGTPYRCVPSQKSPDLRTAELRINKTDERLLLHLLLSVHLFSGCSGRRPQMPPFKEKVVFFISGGKNVNQHAQIFDDLF